MRTKTIKPPVKSDSPFAVNIVQSDHQLITVKHDGKSYTQTFTIPAGKVLNYKSYIALTDDDGYYVGRIKEAIDLASNSTTISASEARPIIHTVTVEQYQLQDINVHLTDPGNIIRFEDETTSYSFTAEDKTKYTSDCSTRLVNYDPGTSDHPGPGDIQENFTIAAETNPQRNENVQVLIYQSPHQTITVDYNGTKHTEPFIIKRRDIVSATIEAEAGYKPGLLNRTKVRATNFDNIIFKASAAGKAKKKIRIRQKHHQKITATYKGKTFETTFEAYLGDKIKFTVEADQGWTAGNLNVDPDYTVVGTEPLEVTVSDAEPITYTVTPIQTPHQTIYIKYGDVRSSTPVKVPSGTRVEFEIVPDPGYNAGIIDKTYAVIGGENVTVSATTAEIKQYTLNIVFDPEAHTTLKVTKDGTVFGTYTENTVLKFQYGTVLTFALTMEEGYTETRNPNSITMNKDNTLIIQGTSKKQFTITLTQTDNQTIYAMYKGVKKTDSFAVEYGDNCTFGIETSNPTEIQVGTLSDIEFTNIKENKTVTATPAIIKPVDLTEYVIRKYPLPNSSNYMDTAIGVAPVSTGTLFYKTINRLREKDFQFAEHATNIISATGAFKNARLVTEFPVIKLKNNINNISYIFAGCVNLTRDELNRNLSAWDLSGPLNIESAFYYCSKLDNIDMTAFNKSSITNIAALFSDDINLTAISNIGDLNTSVCFNFSNIFDNCRNLTSIDISNWDTSSAKYMSHMFSNCQKLQSIDLNKWNTNRVISMSDMFNSCYKLQSISISKWNTSSVTEMRSMFYNCGSLTSLDVSKWDTSSLEYMNAMFYSCISLTSLDVSKWKIGKVKEMGQLFSRCRNLTTVGDVSKWDTSNVTDMHAIFDDCPKLQSIDVSKWNTTSATDMRTMFSNCKSLTSLDVSKWNTSRVTNMGGLFYNCLNLTTVGDVSKWDTSKVTNMTAIFFNCSLLESIDVSKWDIGKATNISSMFNSCQKLRSIDVSKWNTSSVIFMTYVFYNCILLENIDVSKWNTSKVTTMAHIFDGCQKLQSIDVSKWNTSSTSDMGYMFYSCSSLTSLDLSNWDTSKVTDMSYMFAGCSSLTTINGVLDFKHCNEYTSIFEGCNNLTSVKVKNLPTDIDTFCNTAKIDKSKVTVVS